VTGVDDFFEELRREYLTEAPARLAELRKDLAAVRAGETDALASLRSRFHRLAGSGGSYGFPEISAVSREAETWIKQHPSPDQEALTRLESAIEQLAEAFNGAALELGLPSESSKRPAFGWQALIVGSGGPLTDRVRRALADASYAVSERPTSTSPSEVPVSERPDIALLVAEESEDPAALVSRWTGAGPARPALVLLVAGSERIDPLEPPFTGLDFVVAPDRVETELLTFVRAIGRSANAPPSVVMLDPEPSQASALKDGLVVGGARVEVVGHATELRDHLLRESADLIVTEWRLQGTTAAALLRYLRSAGGQQAVPVVVYGHQIADDERVAAVRAGADDVVLKSAPRAQVVQTLFARIDRSRRSRALAHRDDLTGLLNHSSMVDELESALSFAARTEETFGLIVLDIDHFRRVNELHGYPVGDQVLSAVARAVVGAVRSSDFVARLGGEEIGVLVRRCSMENALALAGKLRAAVAEVAVPTTSGEVRVKVSAGIACHPTHGTTVRELLRHADTGLARAKATGRDRMETA